jgi:hypothetical protein
MDGVVVHVLIVRLALGEARRPEVHTGVIKGQCDLDVHGGIVRRDSRPAEYPANTLLVDDTLGIEIQFDSLDNELDEVSFTEAQENRLLAFVGGEIMSVWNAQLIAAGRYRLWTIRARYDTKRQTHAEGAQAWVGFREDLAMRPDNMSPPEKVFKLQPFFLQSELDLADVDPVYLTLGKRAYRPLAPLNLRVAGDGVNPTYGAGDDIVIDWDKAANRSSEDPVTKVISPDIDRTSLEVLTTGDVLKSTFDFSGGTGRKTITNAQLVAALGSETDFNPSSSRSLGTTPWQGCSAWPQTQRLPCPSKRIQIRTSADKRSPNSSQPNDPVASGKSAKEGGA